jgi:hypothetical protein
MNFAAKKKLQDFSKISKKLTQFTELRESEN